MNRQGLLLAVLRVSGIGMLFALFFVFCPFEWMVRINALLALEELVYTPVISYLIRTLSAMYAILGGLLLFVSTDVDRYAKLIRFLGGIGIGAGAGIIVLDAVLGLPIIWTVSEGPMTIGLGAIMLWTCRDTCDAANTEAT
ncbi:MAG: hypothetical protein JW720_14850 [Sedimentisphaerales bacterium]|nr:hypothetical protein [Sedimentisphaerales bacterium]